MNLSKMRAVLAHENSKWPPALVPVDLDKFPGGREGARFGVWRSRNFLVQAFAEADGVVRLSINRAALDANGGWVQDITWDELQRLKAEAGFSEKFAVEIYPATDDVVNVSNMRHLWILPDAPSYAWRRKKTEVKT